jgi:precorrin-6y C5,15-methyltransferase (decarboxylating) CbiE subunit
MIRIVGAGPGPREYLTREAASVIDNSRVLVGGKRILEAITCPDGATKIELPDGMADAVIDVLERESGEGGVTLVVSGDPGFYSLARRVSNHFGRERVSIVPGISSIQIMASRLCRSWAGTATATLHGRISPEIRELVTKIKGASALVVLLGAPHETRDQVEWMTSSRELASAWAAIGWDLGLTGECILESDRLKELDVSSHVGRLAILWLEKNERS